MRNPKTSFMTRQEASMTQHSETQRPRTMDELFAAIPEHIAVTFRTTEHGRLLGFHRASLMDWTTPSKKWKWDAEGATRADALAHALDAMRWQEDAK